MTFSRVKVVIIGGGPAGVSAAIAAARNNASTVLVERSNRLGGCLKQSIDDNYGFIRYDEALTGPEYAFRDIQTLNQTNSVVLLETSISDITSVGNAFQLTLSNRHGISIVEADAIILATGCREMSLAEAGIYGTHPSGVFTAGDCQYYLNVKGQLPAHRCIVLGSDNHSLTVTGNLALCGARVLGVYEPGSAPKGSLEFVSRYLFENNIDINFNHRVTRIFGAYHLRAVEIVRTDESGKPVPRSATIVQCDGLVYSGGFIPNADIAADYGASFSAHTNGPICDQTCMTTVDGIFACGNAQFIGKTADYISESGDIAGRYAANYNPRERSIVDIEASNAFLNYSPQRIDCNVLFGSTPIFFSVAKKMRDCTLRLSLNGNEVFSQGFESLLPSETYRVEVDFSSSISAGSHITMSVN